MVEEKIGDAVRDIEMPADMKYRITENVMRSQRRRRFNFAPLGLALSCLLVVVVLGFNVLPLLTSKNSTANDAVREVPGSHYALNLKEGPVRIEGYEVSTKKEADRIVYHYRDNKTGALVTMTLLENGREPLSEVINIDKSVNNSTSSEDRHVPVKWNDGENEWLVESEELTAAQLREFLKNFNK
ncbi:MAG: hypothetical protein II704_08730 [Erysipelotrichaceae bacterium]|nr:hypothetical protein [Erysipelotrichaceae bacterium]